MAPRALFGVLISDTRTGKTKTLAVANSDKCYASAYATSFNRRTHDDLKAVVIPQHDYCGQALDGSAQRNKNGSKTP
jgi:hypothetical protein